MRGYCIEQCLFTPSAIMCELAPHCSSRSLLIWQSLARSCAWAKLQSNQLPTSEIPGVYVPARRKKTSPDKITSPLCIAADLQNRHIAALSGTVR
jgi:hypothetical protein